MIKLSRALELSVRFQHVATSLDIPPDGLTRLLDLANGKLLRVFEGHTDGVYHAMFRPTMIRVASGGRDGYVTISDVDTGLCLKTIGDSQIYVQCLAAHSDQRRFVSRNASGRIRLWAVDSAPGSDTVVNPARTQRSVLRYLGLREAFQRRVAFVSELL
jgi:WD40 repeat protein